MARKQDPDDLIAAAAEQTENQEADGFEDVAPKKARKPKAKPAEAEAPAPKKRKLKLAEVEPEAAAPKKRKPKAEPEPEAPKKRKAKAEPEAPAPKKARKPKAETNGETSRTSRGGGKFYFPREGEEYVSLRRQISKHKKPVTTKELSEKLGVETWKVRHVCRDLWMEGTGNLEKVGNCLTYTPA